MPANPIKLWPAMKGLTAMSETDKELEVTRVFDAPRELVFKAWTDPEHFTKWWGPTGYTTPVCEIDPRPGGKWRCCMRTPDGADMWVTGVYREIVEPERIVCTDCFSDEDGNVLDPADLGMEGVPKVMLLTVTFEEKDGKTLLTMRQSLPLELARQLGAPQGWNTSFDKLEAHLASL
jgi:uncharacterized protein YndB with AHSA1/START domain